MRPVSHRRNRPKSRGLCRKRHPSCPSFCRVPPVITFMGHVDHGKTSLLDAIRKARRGRPVKPGASPSTIGAYNGQARHADDHFSSITPGHEAFTAMRARAERMSPTSSSSSWPPMTASCRRPSRRSTTPAAAKVSIMVAINKIDLPGANLVRVKGQFAGAGPGRRGIRRR